MKSNLTISSALRHGRILLLLGAIFVSIYSVQVVHAQDDDTLFLPFVTANGQAQAGPTPTNPQVPVITEATPGEVQITVPNTPSPTESSHTVLVEGTGPIVESGAEVTLRYEMVSWDNGAVVESSKEFEPPFTMFVGDDIVPGYLEGILVGKTVGSRILVVLEKETVDLPTDLDNSSAYVLAVDVVDTYTPAQTIVAAEIGEVTAFHNFVSESAPTDGLELGGILFNDLNRNGIQDGIESGIRNVEVLLYADTTGNNWQNGPYIAVANTGLSGNYSFSGLPDGDYIARISPWYFRSNRPLDGFVICQNGTDVPARIDPDNDVDGDNNGIHHINASGKRLVRTFGITLQAGTEPTTEDGDPETNLTLDFCFMNAEIETPPLPNGEVDLTPVAVDDEYVRQIDTTLVENILENDTAGNGPLLVRFISGELAPGLTLNPGGDLVGTVTEIGTYVFDYEISDYDGDSSTATVTVTVQADLMPDAIDDSLAVDAGTPVTLDICVNDDLGDGFGSVTFVQGDMPPGLSLSDCIVSGVPTTGGEFVFEYELMDTDGDVDTAFVTILVNLLPDAVDDTAMGVVDTPFNLDICTNDDFGDGLDSVTFVSGSLAPGLTLDECTLSGTPTIDGTYSFIYQITDIDGDVDTATVTVDIPLIPQNLFPQAVNEAASVEIFQTSSCDTAQPLKIAFIVDDSGSIDTTERSDMQKSLNDLVDALQALGNVQVGIVQFGMEDRTDTDGTYAVINGYTSNLTVNLPNSPQLWADHLPISLNDMNDDGIFVPGGALGAPDGIFIFTDAWYSWTDYDDISTLVNQGLGYMPAARTWFGEYEDTANVYDTAISVYHVEPGQWGQNHSQGMEQQSGLYLYRSSFQISRNDVEYLADNIYQNSCELSTVSNELTLDICANDYLGDGFGSITQISGQVAPGLTLNGCTLSGVATEQGVYSFNYELADTDGDTSIATVAVEVTFGRSNRLPDAEDDSTTTKVVTHSFPRAVKEGTIASWFHETQIEGPQAGVPTANQDGHVLAFPITDEDSQISWWNGDNVGVDSQILNGPGLPEVVGSGIGSISYTQGGYSGAAFLTGVNATSFSNAYIGNQYVEYGFTTAADIELTFVHAVSFTDLPASTGQWLADYTRSILISDDNFATHTVLDEDHVATAGADEYPKSFPVANTEYELKPSTTYKVRVYVYASSNGNNAVIDDFGIQVRANSGDRDVTERLEFNICFNDDYGDGLSAITPVLSSLASGLELNGCYLSGKPAASGTYNFSYELRDIDGDADLANITVFVESEQRFSPIALDVAGTGSIDRINGTFSFDITGNGEKETLAEWFASDAGILIDTRIDGEISGQHLFGDLGGLYSDGFEKLAQLDTDADGLVAGTELEGLALWIDANSNATLDAGEINSLAEYNIVSLSTSHNSFASSAMLADGSTMYMEDLWFMPKTGKETSKTDQ